MHTIRTIFGGTARGTENGGKMTFRVTAKPS